MIVKHENRIRALEAEVALKKVTKEDEEGSGGDGLNAAPALASDEVWLWLEYCHAFTGRDHSITAQREGYSYLPLDNFEIWINK